MDTVFLLRHNRGGKVTLGTLYAKGQVFKTLEPPWKENRSNISCIPPNLYNSVYLHQSASGKYKKVYHVRDVPKRSGILIHNGNLVKHTLGCVLIGYRLGTLARQPAVLNSRSALQDFVTLMDNKPFNIIIVGGV